MKAKFTCKTLEFTTDPVKRLFTRALTLGTNDEVSILRVTNKTVFDGARAAIEHRIGHPVTESKISEFKIVCRFDPSSRGVWVEHLGEIITSNLCHE